MQDGVAFELVETKLERRGIDAGTRADLEADGRHAHSAVGSELRDAGVQYFLSNARLVHADLKGAMTGPLTSASISADLS